MDAIPVLAGLSAHRDAAVRRMAIDILASIEHESSNRLFLRALNDPVADNRCMAANALRHFYDEEEAMVLSENLAIPSLIGLLDDPDAAVRLCAIQALGASEHFRAVLPLIDKLKSADRHEKQALVLALGSIRESSHPAAPLKAIFLNREEAPDVRASALLALKQLGYTDPGSLITELIDGSSKPATFGKDLSLFQALVSDRQHITTISPTLYIDRIVEKWNRLDESLRQSKDSSTAYLDLLLSTYPRKLQNEIDSLVRSPFPEIRLRVLTSRLAKVQGKDGHALLQAALRDPVPEIRLYAQLHVVSLAGTSDFSAIIAEAMENGSELPLFTYLYEKSEGGKALDSSRAVFDPSLPAELRAAIIRDLDPDFMTRHMPKVVKRFHSDETVVRLAWTELLSSWFSAGSTHKAPPSLLVYGLEDDAVQIKSAAVDILLTRSERWARDLQNRLLEDPDQPLEIRQKFLDAAIYFRRASSIKTIYNIAISEEDHLRDSALAVLVKQPEILYTLRIVQNDSIAGSERKRFVSAKLMLAQNALQDFAQTINKEPGK
jgi:hypothetical protein